MADRPNATSARRGDAPSVPFRLNLEQQRKRAKDLQSALKAGDAAAWHRFRVHIPGAAATGRVPLAQAQLVIARELGLPSWPKLKAHVGAMERERARIAGGSEGLDAGVSTLHIRCGSDIRTVLTEGGFAGDFLEYADPFCQGPVVDTPDWLQRRARFIARDYGVWAGQSDADIAAGLQRAEATLQDASDRYQRVVLWFEHDSYDQLILARCLASFAARPPPRLELISIGTFPGGMRFIGLGQLPPEALRLIWETRRAVTAGQLAFGRSAWAALRQPDPQGLVELARAEIPALPHLATALRRHCQELPWTQDGLSLTQRLTLGMLAEGPQRIGQLFHDLMMEREPLPWQSDLLFRSIVRDMRQVQEPVFTGVIDEPDAPWWRERLTITPTGQDVLAGTRDFLSLNPPERWVGGVAVSPSAPRWRWDGNAERAIQT